MESTMMVLKNTKRGGWWIWGMLVFAMLVSAGNAQAPDLADTLDTAAADYAVALAELGLPLEAWEIRYRDELVKLKAKVQAAGDLEQLLAVEAELAALAGGGGTEIPAKLSALKRLRTVYDTRTVELQKASAIKAREATMVYKRKLAGLQAAYTKAGKIEEAKQVRDVLATVTVPNLGERRPVVGTRPSVGVGNQRAGRLVVGGKLYKGDVATIPADMADKPYVRVFAGHDLWYAVTADGTVIHHDAGMVYESFPKDMKKPVVDMACGRFTFYGIHADGAFTHWGHPDRLDKIPEGLTRVKGLAAGLKVAVAWFADGRAIIFGNGLEDLPGGKYPGPESFLQDVRMAAAGSDTVFVVKNDGSVQIAKYKSSELHSYVPKGVKGKNVVAIAAPSQGYGALFLTEEGKVVGRYIDVPEDLPQARQIRMGDKVAAAQLMDGSWRIWGDNNSAELDAQVRKLGPLKDLSLGRTFFVAIK